MNNQVTDEVTTKDLAVAALWYAKGIVLKRVDRLGSVCWFVFGNPSVCLQLQSMFFSKQVEVNAKEYSDALRTLKNLVFSGET